MITPPITLKTFNLQPTTALTLADYKSSQLDHDARRAAYSLQEARAKQNEADRLAWSKEVREFRDKLNPVEWKDFDNRINAINENIAYEIGRGNSGTVGHLISGSVYDLLNDREIQGKQNTQSDYLRQRQAIQTGNYNPYTKRRWDAINTYRDDGTGTWTADFNPVIDRSISDIWALAVNTTPVRAGSNSSQTTRNATTFIDAKGNIIVDEKGIPITDPTDIRVQQNGVQQVATNRNIYSPYSTTSSTQGGSYSYNVKNEQDIITTFSNLLKDENINSAIKQQFDNMVWLYDEANRILNDENATEAQKQQARTDLVTAEESLRDADGIIRRNEEDYKTWRDSQASKYAKGAAYRHESTSSNDSLTTSYDDKGVTRGRESDAEGGNKPGNATSQSTPVRRLQTPGITIPNISVLDDCFEQ